MQEEPGETLIGDGDGTAMWTCPLCQVGQPDRRALASHLTDRHSVLPACLEKLLDIAVPVQCTSGKAGESDSQNNTDAMSEHQEPLENTTSPHEASRQEGELADGDHTLNNTGGKHSSSLEREEGEEQDGLGSQETTGSEQDVASQSGKNMEASARDEKFAGKNGIGGEGEGARPYKCNACQEFFATKTALSVHYNSTSHVQRMRTGSSKQQSGETSPSTTPYLARPYISNKPYQCAVCRVSYNHAITLESHLKSVLHQTRSRSAGNTSGSASAAGGSQGGGAALSGCSVGSGAAQASPAASPVATKEGEQIQPALAPSLLSCPMASAQAVSAFLTLLTSNPSALPHPMLPSLFATGAGPAATPQLVPQPHMLMPLILNGLQNQSPNPESPSQLLPQSVPILGLSAAQQALLVQRLQSQWAAMGLSPAPANLSDTMVGGEGGTHLKEETQAESIAEQMPLKLEMKAEEDESLCVKKELLRPAAPGRWFGKDSDGQEVGSDGTPCKDEDEVESTSDKGSAKKASVKIGQCDSPSSCVSETTRSLSLNKNSVNSLALKPSPTKSNPLKYTRALSSLGHTHTKAHIASPVLSEFQSQLLWAFLESRSEADAASPPQEDCEALSREVGLTEGEVRRWLEDHAKDRQDHAKDRQRSGGLDHMSQHRDNSMEEEDEEGPLMIDEAGLTHSPTTRGTHSAMDLSSCTDRRKEKGTDSCLTSDSENEEFYTSVIVTDEESQSSSMREETDFPMKETTTVDTTGEKSSGGGKVLRSTTVFLSDAEDEDDDEEGVVKREKRKMRKRELDREEVDAKRERRDPDVDLELEAQADPPAPLQVSVDQRGLPSGLLQSLPLSLSLAPFSTQFISPYVLSIPSSVVGVGVAEGDGAKLPGFPAPPAMPRGQAPTGVSLSQSSQFLSNGGECESALDLSIGKNHSSTSTSSSASAGDKSSVQKGNLLDGLGLRPAAVGGPGEAGGLIVVQVKPDPSIAIPTFNSSTLVNRNNLYKPEAHNTREKEKEREKEREQKRPKARRFRDMRRSRTIIQADQLDVLYGCYFKDPNPGKYEFEQISEWVNLPKKVVQIWFQNMRARERKGEVRFISDGTLAAVGKPLIKFTWPLTQPIFSSVPKSNTNSSTGVTSKPNPIPAHIPPKTEQLKDRGTVKSPPQAPNKPNLGAAPILATNTSVTVGQKVKAEPLNSISMVKIAPKGFPPVAPKLCGSSPSPLPSQKPKPEQEAAEEEHTDEEDDLGPETFKPGLGNRTVPKLPNTPISKSSAVTTQKHNGQSYWPQKGPFKINTLSREQLGLGAPRSPSTNTPVISPPAAATPSQGHKDGAGAQHATPRRPRTHLTCLQLSILQSCYETCAHPNALECEAVGVELGLPLKVVQIWFQNTRAKEKRWRLQQEKQSPNSGDPSKKVDVSSGSYLQYNALRANRPILPKPVQLTVVEPSPPTTVGQPAGRETLRGRCEACDVVFESRAMARAHVFSPRHLATLRTTNFGQPAVLPNSGSGPSPGAGSAGAGPAALSPASSTSP